MAVALNLGFLTDAPLEAIVEAFGHTPMRNSFGLGTKDETNRQFQQARTALEMTVGLRLTVQPRW